MSGGIQSLEDSETHMRRRRSPEVVVVTGASAGIGRAVVREFARHGARLGLLARGQAGLEAAKAEVARLGGQAIALPIDVVVADQVEAAAAQVEEQFGPIDIWINDAMTTVFSPFHEMSAEEFERVTAVTYLGVVYGTQAALRRMLPRDRGMIVQVGSALAYRGIPLQSAYCGAKHAIQGFTEAVRCELLHDHRQIWLSMVQLPAVNTPQFEWGKSRMPDRAQPVPPIYQPEVAARAIYYAAHHRRREIYVGLSTVIAILGDKLASGIGDWYLARTGYASQQLANQPENPARLDNLWEPVDGPEGDRGAHGPFDQRAHSHSLQTWVTLHRAGLVVGMALLLLMALILALLFSSGLLLRLAS
jgi:NAD(P)-dependent dehydrogenase (short-subunit alcohol dehydrogenase family)